MNYFFVTLFWEHSFLLQLAYYKVYCAQKNKGDFIYHGAKNTHLLMWNFIELFQNISLLFSTYDAFFHLFLKVQNTYSSICLSFSCMPNTLCEQSQKNPSKGTLTIKWVGDGEIFCHFLMQIVLPSFILSNALST